MIGSARFVLAVVAVLVVGAPAVACDGKSAFFQDNFATTNPGWGLYDKDAVTIGAGSLKITPEPNRYAFVYYRADVYERADACVDATIGAGDSVPDGDGGLLFGSEDYTGVYYFWINLKYGTAGVRQYLAPLQRWLDPMAARKTPELHTNVGERNSLRVSVADTQAVAYLNGQKIVQLKIKPTKVGGFFGLAGGRNDDPLTWTFTNFKITDLP
jgi:hypothetical protein